MPGPIVFISRFRVKESNLDRFRELARAVSGDIEASKPRTLLYLSFLDADQGTASLKSVLGLRLSSCVTICSPLIL